MAETLRRERPDLAYYYPNPVWMNGDWIKNLILFFDGVALLVPEYLRSKPFEMDPAIATGLKEHGLLKILEAETFMDQAATVALAEALGEIFASGALDRLAQQPTEFHELSYSRLGRMADRHMAEGIFREFQKRGLAGASRDGVSIPMHPMARSLVLVLLAQILRRTGRDRGLELWPTTDRPDLHATLQDLLNLPTMPSAGHVIAFDLGAVSVDLGSFPLDEVLGFRHENREQLRKCMGDVRLFVHALSTMAAEDQNRSLADRRADIEATAASLHQAASKAWRKAPALGFSLAGAVWSYASGNKVGALLSAAAAVSAIKGDAPPEVGAFSYLLRASRRFPGEDRPVVEIRGGDQRPAKRTTRSSCVRKAGIWKVTRKNRAAKKTKAKQTKKRSKRKPK